MLVVFSGIDGAGKSTQIELLKSWFLNRKINVKVLWARGGYTPGMTFLKKSLRIFLGKSVIPSGKSKLRSEKLSKPYVAKIWILFSIIDLILYWSIYIRFLKLFGYTIICDRYVFDTELDFKRNFESILFENFFLWRFLLKILPKPDLNLLLLISVKESRTRSIIKDEPFPDTAETIEWRLSAYTDEKNIKKNKFIKIDCLIPISSISNKIILLVKSKINNI